MNAVEVRALHVRYDRVEALTGVSFDLPEGTALGIVGPNGSGKSTLLKTVAGLLLPSEGTVRVEGMAADSRHDRLRAADRGRRLEISGECARCRDDGAIPARRTVRALFTGRS
jgi:ABC-2 type transport system ATP-binding protein